jgi:fibronectin-binding autotransporter adhesin
MNKSLLQPFVARAGFVGLSLIAGASAVFAQTSGTLTTQTSTNYSTAPWNITSGSEAYPDGGGTATFASELNTIIGTVPSATTTITLDVTPTLGAIVTSNPFVEVIAAASTNTLALPTTGATFTLNDGTNTPSYSLFDFQITAPISGGGTSGLTTTGNGGSVLLEGTNTYTGGTHIGAGSVVGVLNSDANLGATGAGNGIEMNGGQLDNDFSGYSTARNVQLDSGGGTFLLFYAMTDSGVVSGPGSLSIDNAVMTLTGANTYTGATAITSGFGGLTLSGTGIANTSSSYDFSGTILLDNTATNVNNRLSPTAPITDRGATFSLNGNATAPTTEADGALTLADGINTFVVTPNAAQSASLSFSSITRQNAATMFVRGTSLGATAGAGVGEIISVASPGTLIGGGGAAGMTDISILPFAIGNVSATATASSNFVTYDPVTGQLRPLASTEYSTLTSGESDMNNTVVTAATAISAPTTVNSVKVTGTGTDLTGTGGLTITSGDILYSPAATTAGTISANLNFGAAEGIISTTAGAANSTTAALTVSGVISGSGGLTINPVIDSDVKITGLNTYTGTTTLLGGLTQISGTIASDGVTAGPFGLSTSAVVLNETGNSNLNGVYATAATTFNRPLSVVGGTNGGAAILLIGGSYAFTLNGAVSVATGTELAGYDTATGSATNAIVYNGLISGGGSLTDEASGTFTVLNAANTYSGGTNMYAGTYVVGIDSTTDGNGNTLSGAFGTGTIYNSDGAKISSLGTAAHMISNPLVLGYTTATFSGTGALTFTGSVNLDGAKTLSITNTAGTTFTGNVSNGSITKTGTGALALSSPTGNTYTGGTVLGANVGNLSVNNTSGSGTGTGTVSIGATSATTYSALSGDFTISGATSIAGRLSPGTSGLTSATAGIGAIGTDNFSTTLTLSSGTTSSLYFEVGGANNYDQINVGGILTLNGTVFIATEGGYTVEAGDQYTLANAGSITQGTFTFNTTGATLAPGVTLTETVTGTQVIVNAVPEPGTLALLGVGGVLGLAGLVRRRRSSAGLQ